MNPTDWIVTSVSLIALLIGIPAIAGAWLGSILRREEWRL